MVVDPPWPQKAGPGFDGRAHDPVLGHNVGTGTNSKTRDLPYSTMSVQELGALAIADIVDEDAHLYLWVTNKHVENGYTTARAWGFRPVTLLTWCKAPMGLGLGGAFVQTTEHILFCRRGVDIRQARVDTTWWNWTRPYINGAPAHSVKPDAFLDIVELVSPGPYLELFARRSRSAWDHAGDELPGSVFIPGLRVAEVPA